MENETREKYSREWWKWMLDENEPALVQHKHIDAIRHFANGGTVEHAGNYFSDKHCELRFSAPGPYQCVEYDAEGIRPFESIYEVIPHLGRIVKYSFEDVYEYEPLTVAHFTEDGTLTFCKDELTAAMMMDTGVFLDTGKPVCFDPEDPRNQETEADDDTYIS